MALSGTGTTFCVGDEGGYGVYGHAGVTVAAGVQGLAVGGQGGLVSDSGSVTNPGGFLVLDRVVAVDALVIDGYSKAGGLDLTDVADSTLYTDAGGGCALWEADSKTLTLNGVKIENTAQNSAGISYGGADPLNVAVRGDCSVSGAEFGILGNAGLTVEVEEDASLTATGVKSAGAGVGAGLGAGVYENALYNGAALLAVTVAQGGGSPPPGGMGSATPQPARPASRLKTTGR